MTYKNTELCRVRTITVFLSLSQDKETWQAALAKAARFCGELSALFQQNGYCVQSVRVVTNPFGEYLDTTNLSTARAGLAYLNELLALTNQGDIRLRFAIGEAKTSHEILLLPELIKEFGDLCNACVNVPADELGVLDEAMIQDSVMAIQEIARITPRGEGNFNFTVNFNCAPHIPYFPASYHQPELNDCFVVGLETPDLLVSVLKAFNQTQTLVTVGS